ncbi:hypothetical protein RCL1_003085 [Eukaryota sp. TZLM3-RCL]
MLDTIDSVRDLEDIGKLFINCRLRICQRILLSNYCNNFDQLSLLLFVSNLHIEAFYDESLCLSILSKNILFPFLLTILPYSSDILLSIIYKKPLFSISPTPILLRNILFAPLVEELSFRFPLLLISQSSSTFPHLFYASLPFAFAHIHHSFPVLFKFRKQLTFSLFIRIISGSLFQIIYTFIFGFYAGILVLKFGIIGTILAHSVANFFQIPIAMTLSWRFKLLFVSSLFMWLYFVISFI